MVVIRVLGVLITNVQVHVVGKINMDMVTMLTHVHQNTIVMMSIMFVLHYVGRNVQVDPNVLMDNVINHVLIPDIA